MGYRNIFEAGAVEITELLADYIEGDAVAGASIALTISERPASGAARDAIQKSLVALEFGKGACTYATLLPLDQSQEGADIPLDEQMLFLLVEGLDPLCVIAADQRSATLLGEAYRTTLPLDSAARVFGRPSALFENLDALLQTPEGKQKAWALFKTLPQMH